MAGDDVVCLAHAANFAEATIWLQALEDEGIDARVVGENLESALGEIPPGQTEVWVHRGDLERARAILDAHHPRDATPEEEAAEEAAEPEGEAEAEPE